MAAILEYKVLVRLMAKDFSLGVSIVADSLIVPSIVANPTRLECKVQSTRREERNAWLFGVERDKKEQRNWERQREGEARWG